MAHSIFRVTLYVTVAAILASCSSQNSQADRALDQFNYSIGTQTIGARYRFTDEPVLIETAKRIREMGSNIIKIALTPTDDDRDNALWKNSLPLKLASENSTLKSVLDMDFTFYFMWVTVPGVDWTDGMSDDEKILEYKALKDLAEYLLVNYNGSDKKFFIGHWEGDWLLLGNYSRTQKSIDKVRIEGMKAWYNIRQKAIEDAREKVSSDVDVYHYLELNRVTPALYKDYDRIVNKVLPYVDVDYVSYSSYESTSEEVSGADYEEMKDYLETSLNYIESKLKPNPSIPGRRVFIGEYGYSLPIVGNSAEEQARRAVHTIRAALDWGCPFILYWEMYDNEGDDKGFWMINSKNEKQPVYNVHEQYYQKMKQYVGKYIKKNGHAPSHNEFREEALDYLSMINP